MLSTARQCYILALSLLLPVMLSGQSPLQQGTLRPVPQVNRISPDADLALRSPLAGHVPTWATPANLVSGSVDSTAPLRLTILLRRTTTAQAAFLQLLADQQTPGSPRYHQWLTPVELGTLFGPTQSDVQTVASWAQSQGFMVNSIAPSRTAIEISGSVETAAKAFQTSFSLYRPGTISLRAPDSEPLLPAALLPVVQFVSGLTEHHPVPLGGFHGAPNAAPTAVNSQQGAHPSFTSNQGGHYITPADFATIYDLTPVLTNNTGATVGGKSQHVAIIGTSDADPVDIQQFATSVGSSSYNFTPIYADGVDPGYGMAQGEATLDLERVLGTAPGVSPDLVIGSGSSALYDAASYAVNTVQDPVITMSFGECEADLEQGTVDTWNDLWSAAAGHGISVFVSAGDSGAAGTQASGTIGGYCDVHGDPAPATQSLNTNGFCTSSFDTCVGGTEFNDTADPSTYWSNTNNSTTHASALSYIPEGAWNDPVETDNGTTTYLVRAGGGGVSQFITKPSWQTGPGVPADGFRDTPDISFSASPTHDPYYYCFDHQCMGPGFVAHGDGGTSATAPTMAAITALLNTATGNTQGNLNPLIYRLANSPAASSIFHDATIASSGVTNCSASVPSLCNNSTPAPTSLTGGLAGYLLTAGYDQATGWGSLDVGNFIKASVPVTTTLALTINATQITTTQPLTATVSLTPAGNSVAAPTGTVQFQSNGASLGSAVPLANNSATSALTFATPGTYTITAFYSGDSYYSPSTSSAIQVTVTAIAPSFTLSAASPSLSFTSGATTGNSDAITLTSTSGFVGSVALSCSVSSGTAAFPPTCTVTPASVSLGASGPITANVTIASTVAQASAVIPAAPGFPHLRGAAASASLVVLCAFGLLPTGRRRRWSALLGVALLWMLLPFAGCGGSSPKPPLRSSAGSNTVTITGNGMSGGALSPSMASTTFKVTIN